MVKKYALDANVFISASRQYYPFDIAPSFWRQLIERGSDKIIIVDRIWKEIIINEDLLSNWLSEHKKMFLLGSSQDPDVIKSYSKIISHVSKLSEYKETAKREFAEVADSWLCAHALARSYIIVTEEIYDPNGRRKIKIPNVCEMFSIKCVNRLQFIREIGIKFE